MKTGDRHSEAAAGGTRSDENVVRFPRDWVGPLDELLPIGPLPRSPASEPSAEAGLPPSADAFWSEDSAALHDAVTSREGAPAPPPPDAGTAAAPTRMPRSARRIPRALLAAGLIPRARLVPALGLVAAVTLLSMAVIGYAESGGAHRTTQAAARSSAVARDRPATETAPRPATRQPKRSTHAGRVRRHPVRARARSRHHVRHLHHAAPAAVTTSTPSVVSTPTGSGTSAAGNSQSGTVAGSGPTTVDSHPVFTPPPAAPAFGQKGTLGPGSSSDS